MRKNHSGYAWELMTYATYPLRQKTAPNRKFFIFGTGRNGSTLLVNLLDGHSQIHCNGELLLKKVLFPEKYLQVCEQLATKPIYGFKLLSAHFQYQGIDDGIAFIQRLVAGGYEMISLRRKDLVRQAISHIYAKHRKQYHDFKGKQETRPVVRITIEELQKELNWMDNLRSIEDRAIEKFPAIQLFYEDDLLTEHAQQMCIERLCNHFEIPVEPVSSDLARITPDDPNRFIENYDELCAYLMQTKFRSYMLQN